MFNISVLHSTVHTDHLYITRVNFIKYCTPLPPIKQIYLMNIWMVFSGLQLKTCYLTHCSLAANNHMINLEEEKLAIRACALITSSVREEGRQMRKLWWQMTSDKGKGATFRYWGLRGGIIIKKLREATHTAAVCKFRGGHFFCFWFGSECGTAQFSLFWFPLFSCCIICPPWRMMWPQL